MKVAVVAVESLSGEQGGAERMYAGVISALSISDVQAELVSLTSDERSFEAIEETMLRFYDLDLSGFDGVISTKAPSYLIRHPNHVCFLIHTMRAFYDMFDVEFKNPSKLLINQRELIHKIDTGALSAPRTKKLFSIGNEVRKRLLRWNKLESEVLHPPLLFDNFKTGRYEYLFMPGRLHRWKRVDLIINALKYVKSPVRLIIAGTGEDESRFKNVAGNDRRIQFLGRVSDDMLIELYANALAVPFVPINEDYGYVTLEAFRSEKPVITCADSGEPAHFVKDGESGFVCPPSPKEIAKRINHLCENRELARAMGKKGKLSIEYINWPNVAGRLLSALRQ